MIWLVNVLLLFHLSHSPKMNNKDSLLINSSLEKFIIEEFMLKALLVDTWELKISGLKCPLTWSKCQSCCGTQLPVNVLHNWNCMKCCFWIGIPWMFWCHQSKGSLVSACQKSQLIRNYLKKIDQKTKLAPWKR